MITSKKALELLGEMNELLFPLVEEYKANPRNKIHINEKLLLISAMEESCRNVTPAQLKKAISAWLSGDATDKQREVYDGACYVCGYAAQQCLGIDPHEEFPNYMLEWSDDDDNDLSVTVRF